MTIHTSTKEYVERAERMLQLVARLERGEVPIDLPWEDSLFQRAILRHFTEARKRAELVERDLRDLDGVKRVFGGHQ